MRSSDGMPPLANTIGGTVVTSSSSMTRGFVSKKYERITSRIRRERERATPRVGDWATKSDTPAPRGRVAAIYPRPPIAHEARGTWVRK